MHRLILALTTAAGLVGASAAPTSALRAGEVPREEVVVEGVGPAGATTFDVASLSEREISDAARENPDGKVLRRGETVSLAMAESVPFVGAPGRWAAGFRGADKVIAVIDSGVSPDFGGTIVGQACFVGIEDPPGSGDFVGRCGPDRSEFQAFSSDCFAMRVCDAGDPNDNVDESAARPCEGGPAGDCAHGSAVAAVAARSEPTPGVAPDADVYAIQVFHDPEHADFFDLYKALSHVVDLANTGMDVAAANLSLSAPLPPGEACDADAFGGWGEAFEDVMRQLRIAGVAVTAASGNDGDADGLGFPACLPQAVSVGATDLADELAFFGNRGSGLDVLAPGVRTNDPIDPLVVPIPSFTQWAGTSFSAPHVAGAFALLSAEYPKASVEQLRWFIRASGVPINTEHGPVSRLRMRSPDGVLPAGLLFPGVSPIAGTERAAVGDFDGDGLADVLAHAPGPGTDDITYGRDAYWGFSRSNFQISGTYTPVIGNFVGAAPGPDELIWYAPGPAGDTLWVGNASRERDARPISINGTYTPFVGDFDDDGWDDIFWYAPGPNADNLWFGGPSAVSSVPTQVNGSYRVSVGDVNGDGNDDIFFHGPGDAPDNLWRGTDARTFDKTTLSMQGSYTLVAGNFDGDAADDILLYQPGSGSDYLWRGGPAVGTVNGGRGGFEQTSVGVSGTYAPVVGDLDGDARDDIVWYAAGPAGDNIWFGGEGASHSSQSIVVNGTYRPLIANFDGDAGDDIVWFHASAVDTPVWWSYRPAAPPAP